MSLCLSALVRKVSEPAGRPSHDYIVGMMDMFHFMAHHTKYADNEKPVTEALKRSMRLESDALRQEFDEYLKRHRPAGDEGPACVPFTQFIFGVKAD